MAIYSLDEMVLFFQNSIDRSIGRIYRTGELWPELSLSLLSDERFLYRRLFVSLPSNERLLLLLLLILTYLSNWASCWVASFWRARANLRRAARLMCVYFRSAFCLIDCHGGCSTSVIRSTTLTQWILMFCLGRCSYSIAGIAAKNERDFRCSFGWFL